MRGKPKFKFFVISLVLGIVAGWIYAYDLTSEEASLILAKKFAVWMVMDDVEAAKDWVITGSQAEKFLSEGGTFKSRSGHNMGEGYGEVVEIVEHSVTYMNPRADLKMETEAGGLQRGVQMLFFKITQTVTMIIDNERWKVALYDETIERHK